MLLKITPLLFVLLLTFVSCEKEQILQDNQLTQENSINNKTTPEEEWGLNNEWYWLTQDCFPTPLNCYDPIVVKPPEQKSSDNIKSCVLKLDDAVAEGSDAIKKFFLSDDCSVLFPNLDNSKGHLSKLQSGIYDGICIAKNNKNYYLFGSKDELNIENPEFVLVVEFKK